MRAIINFLHNCLIANDSTFHAIKSLTKCRTRKLHKSSAIKDNINLINLKEIVFRPKKR